MKQSAASTVRLHASVLLQRSVNVRTQALQCLWVRAETTPLVTSVTTETPRFEYFDADRPKVGGYDLLLTRGNDKERWCIREGTSRNRSTDALEQARAGHALLAKETYRCFHLVDLAAARCDFLNRNTMHAFLAAGLGVDTRELERGALRAVGDAWTTLGALTETLRASPSVVQLAVFRQYLAGYLELDLDRALIGGALPVRRRVYANA